MVGTFALYVLGRVVLGRIFAVPLFWGGSPEAERTAVTLVVVFAGAVAVGAWFAPRARLVGLEARERGPLAQTIGLVAVGVYLVVGAAACFTLIRRLGGLTHVFELQAAWASQIKERGLGPFYSLTYLFVIGCQVLAFRALLRRGFLAAAFWVVCAGVPAVVLGRRVIILFACLPLLSFFHYHYHRLRARHVLAIGVVATVVFLGILLVRLNVRGTIGEAIATSNEFAIYDALVAAVDHRRDLADLGVGYFMRHPADFWGANAGALFMQRITGFQFVGGATPPSAVGVLWVYFGLPGVLLAGVALGVLAGRARLEAAGDPIGAFLYGFVLFYWFDYLRNGDIVLGAKLLLRYGVMLVLLLSVFYRLRFVVQRGSRQPAALIPDLDSR